MQIQMQAAADVRGLFDLIRFGYEQKRCLPITVISGRDQIHELVAGAGLK